MALKHNEVNPLAVNGMRQLEFCPAHFEKVVFDLVGDSKKITDWLYENTDGRFYIGTSVKLPTADGEKARLAYCVAFEVHAEASYFAIMLNTINTYQEIYWKFLSGR